MQLGDRRCDVAAGDKDVMYQRDTTSSSLLYAGENGLICSKSSITWLIISFQTDSTSLLQISEDDKTRLEIQDWIQIPELCD